MNVVDYRTEDPALGFLQNRLTLLSMFILGEKSYPQNNLNFFFFKLNVEGSVFKGLQQHKLKFKRLKVYCPNIHPHTTTNLPNGLDVHL